MTTAGAPGNRESQENDRCLHANLTFEGDCRFQRHRIGSAERGESVAHQAGPMCKESSGTPQEFEFCPVTTFSTVSRAVCDRQPPPAGRGRCGRRRARDASELAGLCLVMALPPGRDSSAMGRQSQGAALASPHPSARGRDGRGRQPPGLLPRAGSRVVPAVTNARSDSARAPNVLDTRARRGRRPGHREKIKNRRSPLGRGGGGHRPSPCGQRLMSPGTRPTWWAGCRIIAT